MIEPLDAVRRFGGLRVLVIGDAMLDSYLEGHATRLCSEGPVPVVARTALTRLPGGAANSAANARALGATVAVLAVIGSDEAGQHLRAALREREIDDRWLVEDDTAATLHKLRVVADGHYAVRFDEGDGQVSPQAEQALLARLDDAYASADVVIVADYGRGVAGDRLIARLSELRAVGTPRPLIVDAKDVRRFATAGATVVTPNLSEACMALGEEHATRGPLPLEPVVGLALARRLLWLLDAQHIVVTLGADGACLLDRADLAVHLPAHPVARAHDVGAGDTFTAALALTLAAGATIEEATRVGLDAAGLAVAKSRTATVTSQELLGRVGQRCQTAADPGLDLPGLVNRLEWERATGRTIVFTNGVFDILHVGHVQLLRRAKALGDLLVVGVNSDRSVRRLKGPGRPMNQEHDRLALVMALDAVDHAVLFDADDPADLIRALRPHIHVKGGDYAGKQLPEEAAVAEVGARTVLLPLVAGRSTTRLIDRILNRQPAGQADTASSPDTMPVGQDSGRTTSLEAGDA
jgi:D-beta-D-heptose 7-phosphate kinase/D-beta-D-heptose 1-phosphate adenosyltransferase